MTLRPKAPKDLLLAPIAAEIDRNLAELRDKTPEQIDVELSLSFNADGSTADRATRAGWVLEEALRFVEMHGWDAGITEDSARLRLSGGSVSIDLGLSATILQYIENGPPASD